MTDEDWHAPFAKCFGVLLDGSKLEWLSPEGEPVRDDTFLLLLSSHHEPIQFTLPPGRWVPVISTSEETPTAVEGDTLNLPDRSIVLLRKEPHEDSN